jgi:very-short-patch-repair endonuclease
MARRKIIPYERYLKEYARKHRNNSTRSEILLWLQLKGKQMRGYDFHRQKPLGRHIADFFCHELMLAIEVDGSSHLLEEVKQKDLIKEESLNSLGVNLLRFTDHQVFEEIDNVLKTIDDYINQWQKNKTND